IMRSTRLGRPVRLLSLGLAASVAACAVVPRAADDAPTASAVEAPDGPIRATPMPSAPLERKKLLSRIVFGSCAQQWADQSIWDRAASEKPSLVLLMGDNVYGDVRSRDPALPELKAAYMRLAQSEPFARLRRAAPVLATWDDHDYGDNDAGADFPLKPQTEALFDYVWALGSDDPRRAHPGVYGSFIVGPDGRRAQVILLDTRYFRSPLKPTDLRDARGKERYLPDEDPTKTMLGDAQWAWLAAELEKPADSRILVSSIQVLADGHGWEAWRTLPREQAKLFETIRASGAKNLVILSGDRHLGAIYKQTIDGQTIVEATASSWNAPQSTGRAARGDSYVEPDSNRLGAPVYDVNYGVLDIDWSARSASIELRGADGAVLRQESVPFTP
ncbi:MAG: alkaline phosphatase family protein, partial [Parvularculaceae bacterium]|nr:alkaline phosphatase family protein [Parvularculaceae bacterium]